VKNQLRDFKQFTLPMPMSQFQWCQADGKEHSITTKLVI